MVFTQPLGLKGFRQGTEIVLDLGCSLYYSCEVVTGTQRLQVC